MVNIIFAIYALLLLSGGIIGKVKGASNASLIAGSISSVLIFLGMYISSISPKAGLILIALVSALLTAIFIIRLANTGKFMPSGMLCLISLCILIFTVLQYIKK